MLELLSHPDRAKYNLLTCIHAISDGVCPVQASLISI